MSNVWREQKISDLTPEHLGHGATQDDLDEFTAAVTCVIDGASYEGVTVSEQDAIDFIWNEGNFGGRVVTYAHGPDDSDDNGEWGRFIAAQRAKVEGE